MENEIDKLIYVSSNWRGAYLNGITHLEKLFDDYLSKYFCDTEERRNDLKGLILCEKVSLNDKRFVFDFLLKKKNPEVIKKYPEITKDLIAAIESRNVIAHYLLDTSEDGVKQFFEDGRIGFARFNHKPNADVIYSVEKFMSMIEMLQKYIYILQNEVFI
jgi:hypothetical protein